MTTELPRQISQPGPASAVNTLANTGLGPAIRTPMDSSETSLRSGSRRRSESHACVATRYARCSCMHPAHSNWLADFCRGSIVAVCSTMRSKVGVDWRTIPRTAPERAACLLTSFYVIALFNGKPAAESTRNPPMRQAFNYGERPRANYGGEAFLRGSTS